MKKLIADAVGFKERTTKDGRPFKAWWLKVGEKFYDLRGYDREQIEKGDVIYGTTEQDSYTNKDGEKVDKTIFHYAGKAVSEILLRVEALENAVYGTSKEEVEEEIPF